MRTPRPVHGLGGPFYRVSDVAAAYGVSVDTVLRWIHAGDLAAERKGERGMFLIPQRALDATRATALIEATTDPGAALTPTAA